jgi:hypothetical protein
MVLSDATESRKGATGSFAAPEDYEGYEVFDARYQRMGRVKELLVNAGGEPEYVRVRVGWLGLRSVLFPVRAVWIDRRRRILMLHQRSARNRPIDGPPAA